MRLVRAVSLAALAGAAVAQPQSACRRARRGGRRARHVRAARTAPRRCGRRALALLVALDVVPARATPFRRPGSGRAPCEPAGGPGTGRRLPPLRARARCPIRAVPCTYSSNGATFDLTSASFNQAGWLLFDSRGNVGADSTWHYRLGICTNIANQAVPSDFGCVGPSPAFQYNTQLPGAMCYRLSAPIASANTASWSLLAPMGNPGFVGNPALGVVLSYTGGDSCTVPPTTPGGPWQTYPRSVNLNFLCWDQPEVDLNATVEESVTCQYNVFIKSLWGCPQQCGMGPDPLVPASAPGYGQNHICSNHGFCDYDYTNGYPKCYCYEGWFGNNCGSTVAPAAPTPKSSGGAIAGALFGGIALGLIVAFVVRRFACQRRGGGGDAGGGGAGPAAYSTLSDAGGSGAAPAAPWSGATSTSALSSGAGAYVPPTAGSGKPAGGFDDPLL
jgi:hypothetical protein